MSRPIAAYVALALLRNGLSEENYFSVRSDFSGDMEELKSHANSLCGFTVSDEDLKSALRILADCRLIRITDDVYSGVFVKIWSSAVDDFYKRAAGQIAAAEQDDDLHGIIIRPSDYPDASAIEKHGILEDYKELGSAWLSRALQGIAARVQSGEIESPELNATQLVPASDRLVTIDHNSDQFQELTKVTEAADEAIRSSNSIDNDDRSWIRDHLAAGLNLIKKHKILASAASALLLQPLLDAYQAVTEDGAKLAILAAINAVKAFFGIG